ncbi:MAG TPA: hypothetical protein VKJ01_14155 [Candidatus Solibacter sp.]|jgi:hypothetical protein|nr:hypothetical protein [Candidatus Solibacter sp.]
MRGLFPACCLRAVTLLAKFGPVVQAQTVTPSFQIMNTLAAFGTNVEAVGVSADGQVIIGKYFLSGIGPACNTVGGCTRTFKWTAAGGVQDLGGLEAFEALAQRTNADGSQIVGLPPEPHSAGRFATAATPTGPALVRAAGGRTARSR